VWVVQISVIAVSLERLGAAGAAAVSGEVSQLSPPHLCGHATGTYLVPRAAGESAGPLRTQMNVVL
jgi:hypothetical protein